MTRIYSKIEGSRLFECVRPSAESGACSCPSVSLKFLLTRPTALMTSFYRARSLTAADLYKCPLHLQTTRCSLTPTLLLPSTSVVPTFHDSPTCQWGSSESSRGLGSDFGEHVRFSTFSRPRCTESSSSMRCVTVCLKNLQQVLSSCYPSLAKQGSLLPPDCFTVGSRHDPL